MKNSAALPLLVIALLVIGASYGFSQSLSGLPSGISGAGVAYINITDMITQSSSTSALVGVTYTVRYNGSGNLNFTLIKANDIKLLKNGTAYKFSRILSPTCTVFLQESVNCTTILINNATYNDVFTLSYDYRMDYPINNKDIFNYTFVFIPSTPTQLNIKTFLPQGAFLPNSTYYSPSNAVFTSNGNTIEVVWSLFQVTAAPLPLPFSVSYELNSFSPNASGFPINAGTVIIIIIVIILVLMGIVVLTKNRKGKPDIKEAKPKKRTSPLVKVLNDNERRILGMLKRDAFITQKELTSKTGFSKAKMSKILSKLSRLKLIKVKPDGRLNKIKRV